MFQKGPSEKQILFRTERTINWFSHSIILTKRIWFILCDSISSEQLDVQTEEVLQQSSSSSVLS